MKVFHIYHILKPRTGWKWPAHFLLNCYASIRSILLLQLDIQPKSTTKGTFMHSLSILHSLWFAYISLSSLSMMCWIHSNGSSNNICPLIPSVHKFVEWPHHPLNPASPGAVPYIDLYRTFCASRNPDSGNVLLKGTYVKGQLLKMSTTNSWCWHCRNQIKICCHYKARLTCFAFCFSFTLQQLFFVFVFFVFCLEHWLTFKGHDVIFCTLYYFPDLFTILRTV